MDEAFGDQPCCLPGERDKNEFHTSDAAGRKDAQLNRDELQVFAYLAGLL